MDEVHYIHSSMFGTYKIKCKVLKDIDVNYYLISYIDPYTEDTITKEVYKRDLVFPQFANLVI